MVMNGVWTTNSHAINISVHDWDENDCLVVLDSVRTCFEMVSNCDHRFLKLGTTRLVPRYAVPDFSGNPLIKRTMKEIA